MEYEEVFCTDDCFSAIEAGIMSRNERIIKAQMREWKGRWDYETARV